MKHSCLMNNLRKIRENCNLTQEEVAEICNVHRGYISRLESGKVGLTEEWIRTFCEIYHCTPNDILLINSENNLTNRDKAIDRGLLKECLKVLIDQAHKMKIKISNNDLLDSSIILYEVAEADFKAGNAQISIGAAQRIIRDQYEHKGQDD